MKRIIVLVLLLLLPAWAWGANHYFATAGNDDTGDGSIGSPWQTSGKANTECGAGDVCYFNRGDTWASVALVTGDTQRTFGAYGTGAKPILTGNGTDPVITANNIAGTVIQDLDIRNAAGKGISIGSFTGAPNNAIIQRNVFTITGSSATAHAVYILASSDAFSGLQIKDNEITNASGGSGIRIEVYTLPIFDITISGNNIHDITGGMGISFYGDFASSSATSPPYGVDIDNNLLTDINQQAININSGIRYVAGHPNYIRRNTATRIGSLTSPNINAFQLHWVVSTIIESNVIDTVVTSAPDGDGMYIDWWTDADHLSSGNTIRYNRITGCLSEAARTSGLAIVGTNNIVHHNIFHGNELGVSLYTAMPTGNVFYNNTIHDNNFAGVLLTHAGLGLGDAPSSIWNNNIISGHGNGMYWRVNSTAPTENYNLFYDNTVAKSGPNILYADAGSYSADFGVDAVTSYGNKITLAGDKSIVAVGVKIKSWGTATQCWAALYSEGGASRLGYANLSTYVDGWNWAEFAYSASAGNYEIWVSCNGSWNLYYVGTACTAGNGRYATPYVYNATPPASIISADTGGNCFGINLASQDSQSLGANDVTGDPLFVSAATADFRTRGGSPTNHTGTSPCTASGVPMACCTGSGTDNGTCTGYAGRPRAGAWSIGAYFPRKVPVRAGNAWIPLHQP